MLVVPHTKLRPFSSAESDHFIVGLKNGDNFQSHFEKLRSVLQKIIASIYNEEPCLENQTFAQHALRDLLLFAMLDKERAPLYNDSDGNMYLATKERGNVCIKKVTGYSEEIVHEFPIHSASAATIFAVSYLQVQDPDDNVHTLLNNNQDVLIQLAERIIEIKTHFSPAVVKQAAQYLWRTEHALLIGTANKMTGVSPPHFSPIEERHVISEEDKKRAQLAMDICKQHNLDDYQTTVVRDNLLHDLFRDIATLNLSPICSHPIYMDNSEHADAFAILCNFLSRHFEGFQIVFSNFANSINPSTNESFGQSLSILLRNPNLTSISFTRCEIINNQIDKISEAIGNSVSIQNVSFVECGISDKNAEVMVSAFNKSTTLRIVILNGNHIELKGVLQLMNSKTVQLLSLHSNNKLNKDWLPEIAAALENNFALHHLSIIGYKQEPPMKIIQTLLRRNRDLPDFWNKMHAFKQSPEVQIWPEALFNIIFKLGMQAEYISREKLHLPELPIWTEKYSNHFNNLVHDLKEGCRAGRLDQEIWLEIESETLSEYKIDLENLRRKELHLPEFPT